MLYLIKLNLLQRAKSLKRDFEMDKGREGRENGRKNVASPKGFKMIGKAS